MFTVVLMVRVHIKNVVPLHKFTKLIDEWMNRMQKWCGHTVARGSVMDSTNSTQLDKITSPVSETFGVQF